MPPITEEKTGPTSSTSQPPKPEENATTSSESSSSTTHHDEEDAANNNDDTGKKSMDRYSSTDPKKFFQTEPCLHSERMLCQAAKILEAMKTWPSSAWDEENSGGDAVFGDHGDSGSSLPPLLFDGPEEQKLTFELAIAARNYEILFEDILDNCEFFKLYPKLKETKSLVIVVLRDYQSRKFQPRRWQGGREEASENIRDIEKAILGQQVKLKAALARSRIRASVPKIEFLLPDSVRRRSSSQRLMPTCAWVNTLKTDPMEMVEGLREAGLTYLSAPPDSSSQLTGQCFYQDPHCMDLFIFSVECAPLLHQHHFVHQGYLICQDKSSCLAAHSIVPLCSSECDVLVVNPGPGWVVAHLSVLLKHNRGQIVVVSPHDDHHHDNMMKNIQLVANKRVKVIREQFTKLDKEDGRLKNVKAVLVVADCSRSAINNMVQYVLTEGENMKVLSKLSNPLDKETDISRLQSDHVDQLRHALKMPKVKGVVYLTRSVHEAENEGVVERSLDFVNGSPCTALLQPWIVIAPVIPFSSADIHHRHGVDHRYIRFQPNDITNGCFLATIGRKPEDAATIIARARSKGLLGKPAKTKKTSGGGDGEEVEDSNQQPEGHDRSHRLSISERRKAMRRLCSPVRQPALKVADIKVPEHHKVVHHPTPFK